MRAQKLRDAAFVLTMLGPWLALLPTMITFDREVDFFGVPAVVLYIFGTWFSLIVTGAYVARKLQRSETDKPNETG